MARSYAVPGRYVLPFSFRLYEDATNWFSSHSLWQWWRHGTLFSFCLQGSPPGTHLVVVNLVNLSCPQPFLVHYLTAKKISKFFLDKISKCGVNSCHLLWQRNIWHTQIHCFLQLHSIQLYRRCFMFSPKMNFYATGNANFQTVNYLINPLQKNGSNIIKCNDLS